MASASASASASLGFRSRFLAGGETLVAATSHRQLVPFAPVHSHCHWSVKVSPPLVLRAVSKPSAETETKPKRQPRGITKPRPISPVMQELLGVSEIPRTQALKQIWAYIKKHDLQDPENKKIIVCDEKLKKIFGGRERVGFLEVSGLMNPHFLK